MGGGGGRFVCWQEGLRQPCPGSLRLSGLAVGTRRPLSHMQAGSRQGGWACAASRASWVTLSFACKRQNLLSFSSPERSFRGAGLWAELCVCSLLMPEPPARCDVVCVSDSGPGAFQFAGSGICPGGFVSCCLETSGNGPVANFVGLPGFVGPLDGNEASWSPGCARVPIKEGWSRVLYAQRSCLQGRRGERRRREPPLSSPPWA